MKPAGLPDDPPESSSNSIAGPSGSLGPGLPQPGLGREVCQASAPLPRGSSALNTPFSRSQTLLVLQGTGLLFPGRILGHPRPSRGRALRSDPLAHSSAPVTSPTVTSWAASSATCDSNCSHLTGWGGGGVLNWPLFHESALNCARHTVSAK